MPLLPLQGNDTLCYGSGDAGVTVLNKFAAVDKWLEHATSQMKLAPHWVRDQVMYTGGDVEVHFGKDMNFYLLDLARTFPPEDPISYQMQHKAPKVISNAVFFRMMRPELLSCWASITGDQFPVSSDVFSRWGEESSDVHNSIAKQCCSFMFEHQIPLLAAALADSDSIRSGSLATIFHKHGVNLRHLALVGIICVQPLVRTQIAEQIVIRVLKCLIRQFLRDNYKVLESIIRDGGLQKHVSGLVDHIKALSHGETIHSMQGNIESRFGPKAILLLQACSSNMDLNRCVMSVYENFASIILEVSNVL
jgi:hypothetical protein